MAMLSKNALILLKKRYLKRDRSKRIVEDPEGLFRRVAHAIALAESNFSSKNKVAFWEAEFYSLLTALDFLPNSPTLMNAGREMGQLSACFVLPIEDSMTSIFETLKNAALIQQSGGGCGYNFSALVKRSCCLLFLLKISFELGQYILVLLRSNIHKVVFVIL